MAKRPAKRTGRVIQAERIREVAEFLLGGYTRSTIVRHGAEHWCVGSRAVDKYIRAASDEIIEINKDGTEKLLAIITRNLWSVFRKHIDFNPSAARQALMDIAKLRGIDNTSININIDRKHKDASDEDLDAAIFGTAGSE